MDISFRPITPQDETFLVEVYFSTRAEEMAATGWTRNDQEKFIQSQFHAQYQSYSSSCPSATFEIVLMDGQPAGRLYVDRRPDEIRLLDFSLLPHYRSQGIGTQVIQDLCSEASRQNQSVSIHVNKQSRAEGFFSRHGFRPVLETEFTLLWNWKKPGLST